MSKQILKYLHENERGLLHYVVHEGKIVTLSNADSLKVKHIKEHGALQVSFDLKSEEYDILGADILTEPAYVQDVYNVMEATGNSYFKDGIEGLCVIVFHK